MRLDCVKQRNGNWAIIDTRNGGIVATSDRDDCGFAWMAASHKLAEAIEDMQRTIINLSRQEFGE